jgi:hypothetical protein
VKGIFGVVSLLIAVALITFVMGRQIGSMRRSAETGAASAPLSGSGPVGAQARQLENQVVNDIGKAAQQDAARRDAADK